MTKYVISGYIGFDNFGDEAIAEVLTSHLKKLGAEKITVISSNPEKTSKLYDVDSCKMLDFLKPIADCDVFISGGGSLLQDVTSLKSLVYYLALITYALALNKKVIIFAQGFTPFRTKIGKFLTKHILKHCYKISVRDTKSQKLLNKLGIESELVTDPVFGIDLDKNQNKEGVGIQLRSYRSLNDIFLNQLADEVAKHFSNKEIKLFSLQDSLDLAPLQRFAEMLESRNIKSKIYQNLDTNKTIEELSKLEYLIGMRFHACLVSAKAGVKTLGINYDVKVQNLAKAVSFPSVKLDEKTLTGKFEELLNLDTNQYKIPEVKFPEI